MVKFILLLKFFKMRGLKTYIHETELNGKRVDNALLDPALYDDAFNILWKEANKCVN